MKAIGIKQLKARLSEYVRRARAGEVILVTDRDEVVAELRPTRQASLPLDSTAETFDALAQAGTVTLPARSKKRWTWKVKGLGLSAGTADAMLDDLRGDRT
jgi:antitoxin (DNA-binding transcriptional repressor) of toxin-antitoxin stability system